MERRVNSLSAQALHVLRTGAFASVDSVFSLASDGVNSENTILDYTNIEQL